MPWEIKKKNGKYCVVLESSGKPIPGGCHEKKEDAVSHLRALYVNTDEGGSKPRGSGGRST